MRRASKVAMAPRQRGGGHERGLRSGTLNVPGIVGFGEAARLARLRRAADAARLGRPERPPLGATPNGAVRCPPARCRTAAAPAQPQRRVRRTHRARPGSRADRRGRVPGAACASTSAEPSHVLIALGLSETEARSSLRFGLLRTTTEAEVDELAQRVITLVTALRSQRSAGGRGGL